MKEMKKKMKKFLNILSQYYNNNRESFPTKIKGDVRKIDKMRKMW